MALFTSKITIYLAWKAQITFLIAKKITILIEYADFSNVFSKKLGKVLPKRINIFKYTIKLVYSKQPLYRPIYSLDLVEFKTLKTYIKINLACSCIWTLKSLASVFICFVCKPNSRLCFYINYQKLNNLTIKNWYPLLLVGKFLDLLERAKCFIQLNFTSTYYWIRIKEGHK